VQLRDLGRWSMLRSLILMYHSITRDEPVDPFGVTRDLLEEQVRWLREQGCQFVPLSSLVEASDQRMRGSGARWIVMTFDDGYRDFLENAMPVLTRYQVPATVFVVTGALGQCASWSMANRAAPLMTQAEARQVRTEGISLGSHTEDHVDLTSIGDEEQALRQLTESRKMIGDLGEVFFALAYPWGRHSAREVALAKAAGYDCAVTASPEVTAGGLDRYRLGRLAVRQDMDREQFQRKVWRELKPGIVQGGKRLLRTIARGVSAQDVGSD
jgi:peptidoglycan/xylan/chitin deacetylase (PgdA/CDA1 family)